MADVGQLLLQNELFVVLGATLFAALPAISPYWLPVIYPNSAPEQFQLSSGTAIANTVTRTATIFPKPTTLTDKVYQTIVQTQTATRTTTTTATVPKTIYDTVTERVTSVSTYYDRHYLTKWTHFSVDPATPCTTVVYSPDVTIQSPSTPASEACPLNVAQLPTTTPEITSWVPWKILLAVSLLANLFMWFWYLRAVDPTGEVQRSQEAYEIMKRSRQDVRDKYAADRTDLIKRCQEAERVAVMVGARDVMLQKLGVSMPSDEADNKELDKETLANMVQARINVLVDEKQRLDHLETENKAQTVKIRDLEKTIATRLTNVYVPGVSRSFDELLRSKQREIDNLRNMLHNSSVPEHIKENDRLHEAKDVELSELRPLREEVTTLREALIEAKNETELVEEQKKAKGVADERRWNDERTKLRKEQTDKISALKEKHDNKVAALESDLELSTNLGKTQKAEIANLKAELRKTKRSLATSERAKQSQSSSRPDIKAPRQRFNNLNSEQDTSTETVDYLQRNMDEADQRNKDLENNFKVLSKLYRDATEELERLKDQKADDKKTCENEKKQLRQRITELERALEKAAQIQGSQSSAVTGLAKTDFQSGSTAPDNSSKVNETAHKQLEERIASLQNAHEAMVVVETDLRARVASLSKDIQVKEAKEVELSTQVSTSREQLEAKLALEQALSTQVATLTQQRDTAIKEGEAVWSELQDLKATRTNDGMAAARLVRYQAESAQRDQNMEELKKSNTDLQAQNDQLRKQGIHEINSRNQQILQLQTDATIGNQTIRDLEQQLSALKADNGNKDQTIQGHVQHLGDQQHDLTAARATIGSLQKRIEDIKAEVAAKKNEIDKLNARAQDQNQVIRDQQATINAAPSTTQAEALKKELQAEKDKYLIDVNNLKNDVDRAQRELEKEKEGRRNDVKLRKEAEIKKIDEVRRESQQEINDWKNSQESSTIKKLQERVDFYEMENSELKENGKEGWKSLLKRKDTELEAKEKELRTSQREQQKWYNHYNSFHRRWSRLSRNQDFEKGKVTYDEVRDGLFMGSDKDIQEGMEKYLVFNNNLQAEVETLKKEVAALQKYADKRLEDEMDMDEKMGE